MSSNSTPGGRKVRALDMLDRHMNSRINSKKMISLSQPTYSEVRDQLNSNSPKTMSDHGNFNVSPTPKRRKLNNEMSEIETPLVTILNAPEIPPPDLMEKKKDRYNANNSSSPRGGTPKSVAFSDKIESSPTNKDPLHTPSRPSSITKPKRSILRNSLAVGPVLSDISGNKLQYQNTQTGTVNYAANNFSTNSASYWVAGEVHSMLDPNDISEFRDIIEGGINMLEVGKSREIDRRFEVFATFNNIIPIVTSKTSNEVVEKKIEVIISFLARLYFIASKELEVEQTELLNDPNKKNPFSSRLYVQIVRLLTLIYSSFKIMKWVNRNIKYQQVFKEIFKLSIEALASPNANKVIIAAQTTFLREEKFSSYFLNKQDIEKIVECIPMMNEINSTNLICEKLLLIKSFLIKHPAIMIKKVKLWLPSEVLSRILVTEEVYTMKIGATAISVLLELLKKSIDNVECKKEIYQCLNTDHVYKNVPNKFSREFKSLESQLDCDHENITFGHLLKRHIKLLIYKKEEYKLAMDLWLALMALMYNNEEHVVDLAYNEEDKEWISINQECFEQKNIQAKIYSIKVWRIIQYCVFHNISNVAKEKQEKLLRLLLKPFDYCTEFETDQAIKDGLIYYFSGLMYAISTGSETYSERLNNIIWSSVIEHIYLTKLPRSLGIQFYDKSKMLLQQLLSNDVNDRKKKSFKNINMIKVIASAGIEESEIPEIDPRIICSNLSSILAILLHLIRTDIEISGESNNKFYNILLSNFQILDIKSTKKDFITMRDFILEVIKIISSEETYDYNFMILSLDLIKSFKTWLFDEEISCFSIEYLLHCKKIGMLSEELAVEFYKYILKECEGFLSDLAIARVFLDLGYGSCASLIAKKIGSYSLTKDLSLKELGWLCEIMNIIPEIEITENKVDKEPKFESVIYVLDHLNFGTWKNKQVQQFLRNNLFNDSANIANNIFNIVEKFSEKPILCRNILACLLQDKEFEIIKRLVGSKPTFLEFMSDVNMDTLSNIIPINQLDELIEIHSSQNKTIKKILIRFLLFKSDKIENYPDLLKSLFYYRIEEKTFTIEEKEHFIITLLGDLLEDKLWNPLNLLCKECFINDSEIYMKGIFQNSTVEQILELDGFIIAKMACKPKIFDQSLITKTIKKCFECKDSNFNNDILEILFHEENFGILRLLKKEVIIYLTEIHNSDIALKESSRKIALIQEYLNMLFKNENIVNIIEFVKIFTEVAGENRSQHIINITQLIQNDFELMLQTKKNTDIFRSYYLKLNAITGKNVLYKPSGKPPLLVNETSKDECDARRINPSKTKSSDEAEQTNEAGQKVEIEHSNEVQKEEKVQQTEKIQPLEKAEQENEVHHINEIQKSDKDRPVEKAQQVQKSKQTKRSKKKIKQIESVNDPPTSQDKYRKEEMDETKKVLKSQQPVEVNESEGIKKAQRNQELNETRNAAPSKKSDNSEKTERYITNTNSRIEVDPSKPASVIEDGTKDLASYIPGTKKDKSKPYSEEKGTPNDLGLYKEPNKNSVNVSTGKNSAKNSIEVNPFEKKSRSPVKVTNSTKGENQTSLRANNNEDGVIISNSEKKTNGNDENINVLEGDSSTILGKIKIPIFNSLRMANSQKSATNNIIAMQSIKRLRQRHNIRPIENNSFELGSKLIRNTSESPKKSQTKTLNLDDNFDTKLLTRSRNNKTVENLKKDLDRITKIDITSLDNTERKELRMKLLRCTLLLEDEA
ncbi:hypothetical protein Kpol_1035p16 [Vanderwaltozyma polyspora DSM 70294]|uniref:Telomere-associated protein Rif1 N-terminal domain-containing protein n=1 Tax=Vanderwaltozyma polyspora (strain ATCC 22028 / DSM 70294 / BCRC 21397 / CBS 2163 / NBRC 10782 / NRRL Y-8283 / UCD 57-17) TaxID=436907 RepID=A7TKI1_VANPO|nr:uncharacterized protein Kpol_1035p16 [Vanderwaltozyma polyspora DSM 70294]EDO17203.1 hypothetical protein Kpol_1035p16 [Vanderwaltozyma polyspora DSM 70294]